MEAGEVAMQGHIVQCGAPLPGARIGKKLETSMQYRHPPAKLFACDLPAHPLLSRVAKALQSAAKAEDAEFEKRFLELTAEIESAFFLEEAWMENRCLPSLKSQREQHARVLQGMHYAHAALMQGQAASSRKVVASLLPLWLPSHFTSMRQALDPRKTRNALDRITAHRRDASGSRRFRQ